MFSVGSVMGKALTIGIEILPIHPLIFTGSQKVQNLTSFSTLLADHSTLSRPRLRMQQDIRTLKQKYNDAMIALCPCEV